MTEARKKSVTPVARKRRRPAQATGPDMMTDGTSPRNKSETCGINDHSPRISLTNMSISTTDACGMTQMTKNIVGLMQTTENIVGMTETTKGMSTALRGSQESRKTWTDTGIVLSLSTAGIQE
jgi:hypothetical protein